jgi:hypothetical protein
MTSNSRALIVVVAATVTMLPQAHIDAGRSQRATAPRLREGHLPTQMPEAFGGGEVILELAVDSRGAVTRIDRVRVTPPYTDLVADSAAEWRFAPATAVIDGHPAPVAASVLVVAIFRPPSFYAGPATGVPPDTLGAPSTRLPRVHSVVMPAYPPTATGSGLVLIEIEMDGHGERRGDRVVGPTSGFDAAALDAVRAWRFGAPPAADAPNPLFAYAVVGFRAPVALATPQRK